MLFNEKFAIGHINFSTGWITIDAAEDRFTNPDTDSFSQLLDAFSRLIGGKVESLGMMQYRISKSPHDFVFQCGSDSEIAIVVENINEIDAVVKYIIEVLAEINANMLWEHY